MTKKQKDKLGKVGYNHVAKVHGVILYNALKRLDISPRKSMDWWREQE